jgi:O-antigen/teichoic acid export membrane protein
MNLAATAARGGLVTLGSQVLKVAVLVCSTIALGRILTPTDFGLVAMVVAIIGFGEILRDFGLSMAALQAKSLSREQQSNLFWINAAVGFFLFLIAYFSAAAIAEFYGQPDVESVVRILSITFLVGGVTTQFKVALNRDLKFTALAIIDLVPSIAGLAAAVTIAACGGGYWALVVQYMAIPVLGLILAVWYSTWYPGLPHKAPMKNLLSFGASFAGTQLVSFATRNVDSIVVGKMLGAVALGIYDRAYQLVMMPINQINTPMSRVAVPVLSRVADDPIQYLTYLRRAQLVGLYGTASIFAIFAGMGQTLVVVILGPQWAQAGAVMQILAVGAIFRSLVQVCYWVYMSRGLAHEQFRYFLISQPLLTAFIVSGVIWGVEGVAIAHSVGFALYWFISVLWMGRVSGLDVWAMAADAVRAVGFFSAPAAIISYIVSTQLNGSSHLLSLFAGVASAAAWFGIAVLISKSVRRDIRALVDVLQKAASKRSSTAS